MKNYRLYMKKAETNLKDDGLAFIHTIGGNVSTTTANEWTTKYIFPNSMIPSISQTRESNGRHFRYRRLAQFRSGL